MVADFEQQEIRLNSNALSDGRGFDLRAGGLVDPELDRIVVHRYGDYLDFFSGFHDILTLGLELSPGSGKK